MDLFAKCREFHDYIENHEAVVQGYNPFFVPNRAVSATETIVDGESKLMIGSNNYLGLTHHPKVLEAARDALMKYGSGCTGSRFLNGTLDLHVELEERLAAFVGKPGALVFSTGYQTNLGTLHSLLGRKDVAFIDADSHACIVDGVLVSRGEMERFKHNDMDDFERKIKDTEVSGGSLVATDGVFSMSGAICDLPGLLNVSQRHGVRSMVDDAHSIGVLGPTGAGTAEHFGETERVDLITATFSKSFACIGGFVAADEDVITFLKFRARSFIFSASMPPSAVATVIAALDVIESEPERREQLWKNARMMHDGLRGLGFNIGDTETPIVPVIIGDDMKTFIFWKSLLDAGIFANSAVSPAVPANSARIRTSYTAAHTEEQLSFVLETFERIGKQLGVI
ncbi:MAG: aminotransferase class I/II-fold pyridoxal phosphate-dependent enzyme [Candidatus Poribacteria bacterium]|nr:aminotransferase class I/II-fold pyridoxal phosphate-dependent enzyme [Candidatus Poribacteria bacterium]